MAAGTASRLFAHYALWQHCALTGEPLFIFEDDVCAAVTQPAEQCRTQLRTLVSKLHAFPDIVYWGHAGERNYARLPDTQFLACGTQRLPIQLHAYLLYPAGARALLSVAELVHPADIEIICAARRIPINAYCAVNQIFVQRSTMPEYENDPLWAPGQHKQTTEIPSDDQSDIRNGVPGARRAAYRRVGLRRLL